ncbi:hypothetical protein IQ07DRAFT_667943 [Pyrenochaeta sp. DS3sAY3a]|nr:hypothetical protein IQ07DRAFT_667943 [Pyrenochaeta sp. DS3sAY3a]
MLKTSSPTNPPSIKYLKRITPCSCQDYLDFNGGSTSDEDVLPINTGGDNAGDLYILRKALGPEVKLQLILQELKHIVDKADQVGYEAQVGDWNKLQLVKGLSPNPSTLASTTIVTQAEPFIFIGARACMLQHILHDFTNDGECRHILINIFPAMKPVYSKLLIPDRNAPWALTSLDVNFMETRGYLQK